MYGSEPNANSYAPKVLAFAEGASFAVAFFAVALGVWVWVQGSGIAG